MSDALTEARAFFKNLPAEVFDPWMIERVETAGWPPRGARWNAVLGGYSPAEWAELVWFQEGVDLGSLQFSDDAVQIIRGLMAARFAGATNAYSNIENSQERMRQIHAHLKATRLLPGSVVLVERPESVYELIDGCHRVAMYCAWLGHPEWRERIERVQSSWVGREP
jgi:hypothetical protein